MKIIVILLFYFMNLSVYADIHGRVFDGKGEPLQGINVYWYQTTVGTVTNETGAFTLPRSQATTRLIFSSVVYNNDTIDVSFEELPLEIKLTEIIELKEVTITQRSPGIIRPRFSVMQLEKITTEELYRAACCNLSESFETNPSVDVVFSDAATGAKQIRLLGLSGTYVQMLTENIPNLRGISSVYGLGFIPGPWMEGIQVSKGTGSVINGYEAITGQINVEYKKPPTSEIIFANVFASDAGRVEGNLNASVFLTPELSTGILLHASDELLTHDADHDGYMDMPMVKQQNFINRWYYRNKRFVSQAFIRALSENRMGGTVDHSFMIDIDTKRYEFFLKNGFVFNPEKETSAGLILSGSLHHQDAHYGKRFYDGKQDNFYANLIFQTKLTDRSKISTGLSYNYDRFDELLRTHIHHNHVNDQKFDVIERVAGAFGEYSFNLDNKWMLLTGLRADIHNQFGLFITPRMHLRYSPDDHFSFRATIGKGYRSPRMLAENNFYLASNRELRIEDNLKMEEAWNTGLSVQSLFHVFNRDVTLSGEWYYTNFLNQVVIDVDTDVHEVHFYNLVGKSFAHSIQVEANMVLSRGLTLTLAHRLNDVQTSINGVLRERPLTNRYKGLATVSYQTSLKKWQFDFSTQFNGGGRLPDPDPVNPRWEKEFPSYMFMLGQITRYFRTWSVYFGSENLTNFVQPNPIIDVANPNGRFFDATSVWGPTHGRKLYIGMRWAIDRT